MQYREDKISGNKLSMLGLGCMRFSLNKAETERMILSALAGGINFFDTAYIYPNSEHTLGEILKKHNKRKDVYIATKLPLLMCKKKTDFDKFFNESLKRLQTDYVDYYLMHSMTDFAQWGKLQALGIEEWLAEKRADGQIRRIGFSYHGICNDFLKLLDVYNWEICMIQYNYYDENYQAGKRGLLRAHEKGIPVMIMEPLLGGSLATGLPKQAVALFQASDPKLTPADWAFWWLWNQPEVTVTLSGVGDAQIMAANLDATKRFRSLTEKELAVYADVVDVFRRSYKINCTGCDYCLPCPKGINIPGCFSSYNISYVQKWITGMTLYATTTAAVMKNPASPYACNGCGKCERVCPQNLPIRQLLKKVTKRMEPLPIRVIFSLIRNIMK